MRRSILQVFSLAGAFGTLTACATVGTVAETMANPQGAINRALSGCAQVQQYQPGTAVQGEFTTSDCYSLEGERREPIDDHQFTTTAPTNLHAVVEAPGLDVNLVLFNGDGMEIKSDPFVGDYTYISTQVPAGTYRLGLRSKGQTSSQGRVHGRYTLRSSTDVVGFEGCPTTTPIRTGQTIQGEWSVADCTATVSARF